MGEAIKKRNKKNLLDVGLFVDIDWEKRREILKNLLRIGETPRNFKKNYRNQDDASGMQKNYRYLDDSLRRQTPTQRPSLSLPPLMC